MTLRLPSAAPLLKPTQTAVLEGIAGFVPPDAVANDALPAAWDVDDAWVRRRTGIRERRRAAPGVTTGDLALEAARRALAVAGHPLVDTVIVGTSTPDRPMPAMAPRLATRLGLGGTPAWDVSAACSGFVYGLAAAVGALNSGCADRVLLVTAEVYSTLLDPQDRSCGILFGDGAAATVLRRGARDEPGGVVALDLGSDGSGDELIQVPGGGALERSRPGDHGPDDRYFRMRGREVFQHAVTRMTQSAHTVLKRADWTPEDIDRFCAHQANARILSAVGDRIPVSRNRHVTNIERVGNTGAASIPLALADAAAWGELRAGERVLLTAFGAGLTWGSAVLVWPELPRVPRIDAGVAAGADPAADAAEAAVLVPAGASSASVVGVAGCGADPMGSIADPVVCVADLAVCGADLAVSAADPVGSIADPAVRGADTAVCVADLAVCGVDPAVSAADPVGSIADLVVSAGDSAVCGADPALCGADPAGSIADLAMRGADPAVCGADPVVSAGLAASVTVPAVFVEPGASAVPAASVADPAVSAATPVVRTPIV